jgi:hypothetical protein
MGTGQTSVSARFLLPLNFLQVHWEEEDDMMHAADYERLVSTLQMRYWCRKPRMVSVLMCELSPSRRVCMHPSSHIRKFCCRFRCFAWDGQQV